MNRILVSCFAQPLALTQSQVDGDGDKEVILQQRPLQELHNLEARAIQSVCGASAEKTEALSLSGKTESLSLLGA